MKKTGILKYTLSFILAAILVYFAFRGIDWKAFLDGLVQTRWAWVALFCLTSVLALVLRTIRWKLLLQPLDPDEKAVGIWNAINVGNMVNTVLPGAGELVRCGYVTTPRATYEKAFGTMLMERAWDVLAIILLLAGALAAGWGRLGAFFMENIAGPLTGRFGGVAWTVIAVVVAALVLAFWLVFRYRARSRFCGKVADALSGFGRGFASALEMKHKWAFILSTVALWGSYVLMSWCGLKAVPQLAHLGFADALFISAIGNVASVIPVPGGIGAYHYLVALTLSSLYGATWETGILYATLCHEVHAVLIVLLGIVSYICISIKRNGTHNPKELHQSSR